MLIAHMPVELGPQELTSDEVWLLKLISTGEAKTPSKVNAAVKTVRGFQDFQAMLSSLRQRGFIYYNDWNDLVIALPKAYQYLATYEARSEKKPAAEFVAEPQFLLQSPHLTKKKTTSNAIRSKKSPVKK